MSEIVN